MKATTSLLRWAGIGAVALGVAPAALAQGGSFGGGFGPPLQVVKPPREFATSEEHYAYLLEQAKGGTKHTLMTVPRWDGLWQPAGNTHLEIFIEGQGFAGSVRAGVRCATPAPIGAKSMLVTAIHASAGRYTNPTLHCGNSATVAPESA